MYIPGIVVVDGMNTVMICQYDVSNLIDVQRTTVEDAINRVATTTGTTLTGKSMGRSSSFDDYTKRHLERIIRSNSFQTIETLQGQLRSMSKYVSRTTVKNWIKKLGFKYRSAERKSKLSDDQKKNRFESAIEHDIGWTDKQWEQVVWSDESKFC
ncbi:hypothetical protein INT46_010819 [Mucor plumbeus]|uniref:Transposase Tc1-like domain-containing protein n=1 Tax=Mucor plumbeus TaxID=97098 RepID=A0A8H7RSI6_9FUNG|nr:hypothetical protein INT46_010819 [Mucor plumbeus]